MEYQHLKYIKLQHFIGDSDVEISTLSDFNSNHLRVFTSV